jgi:hypothetical protein
LDTIRGDEEVTQLGDGRYSGRNKLCERRASNTSILCHKVRCAYWTVGGTTIQMVGHIVYPSKVDLILSQLILMASAEAVGFVESVAWAPFDTMPVSWTPRIIPL